MNGLLEHYQAQAIARRSSLPWLAQLQQQAMEILDKQGFPGRFDEDWKYTRVDALLQHPFTNPELKDVDASALMSDAPGCLQVHVINGQVVVSDALLAALPKGMLVLPLMEALTSHAELIESYLTQNNEPAHGFQALNTALLQTGLFIYLPKGLVLEKPLLINHWQDKDQQAVHLRHLIVAEEAAQASIIEDYRGQEACCYFSNTMTDVFTHPKASLCHYKIQRESKAAYHIGHLSVKQQAFSQFESHSLSLGGKLVRSDIHIQLQQPDAQCLMNGIYAPMEGQHVDHHTTVEHQVPDCRSTQDYKGILAGHSRAVFNGKVVVAKDAQHSHAEQQNKNLLLSEQAEIDTKPQLEIFADDVVCSHGATVGQLDEDALFYLATRGIDRAQAMSYLIHAFAAQNLARIPQAALADWMTQLLNQQLG